MGRLTQLRASVPLSAWTLERFGVSPAKVTRRASNPGAPKVLLISIPKAGTHLLERAICLHPRLYRKLVPTVSGANLGRWRGLDGLLARVRPGQVVVSHLWYRPEYPETLARHGIRSLFLVRDPHDIVVSQVHYVSKRADHQWHAVFADAPDALARLRLAIRGDPAHGLPSIRERLDFFRGWLEAPGALTVRFEDLIGPGGGGDRGRQEATVTAVYEHLGLAADPAAVAAVCERLFSTDSPTFRMGAIGGWRKAFDRELEDLFDSVVGDAAAPYGY